MKRENPVIRIIGVIVRIVLVVVAAMFVMRVARIAYQYGYEIFAQQPVSQHAQIITITVGEHDTAADVAKLLEDKGLVRDDLLFRMQEMFSDYHGLIAPGTYDLATNMTPEAMLSVMSAKTLEQQGAAQEQEPDGNSRLGGQEEEEEETEGEE